MSHVPLDFRGSVAPLLPTFCSHVKVFVAPYNRCPPNLINCLFLPCCSKLRLFPHQLFPSQSLLQGCIFFYNPPPGVGEKNQRVLGLGKKIKEE